MEIEYKNKTIDVTLRNSDYLALERKGYPITGAEKAIREQPIEFSLAVLAQVIDDKKDEILDGFPSVENLIETAGNLFASGVAIPLESRPQPI